LPNTIIDIGGRTFANCTNLINVDLPENINSIQDVFFNCTSLNNQVIPKLVNRIDDFGFYNCTNLTRLNFLGNSPTSLGRDIFTLANNNLKIYRKKNFVTGWGSTLAGRPVVLWSDNVIKDGGVGKLTTKKRN
jgi:hypothetical protein